MSGVACTGRVTASLDGLCALIASELRVATDAVLPGLRLVEDLRVDSLEMHSLLLAIEQWCGGMPSSAQMETVDTVADLYACLQAGPC